MKPVLENGDITLINRIVYIAIIIGLTWLIITFVGQRTRVSGHSMEATLHDGDNLIVDLSLIHI